jgi:hypothetical protein
LVSSQLSRMPGEERKFRRRRIVAFVPACKRERDVAASHAEVSGISAAGVIVGPVAEGPVGVGSGVEAGWDRLVSVGDGVGDGVAVRARGVGEGGTAVGFAVSRCSVAAGRIEAKVKAFVGNRVEIVPTD